MLCRLSIQRGSLLQCGSQCFALAASLLIGSIALGQPKPLPSIPPSELSADPLQVDSTPVNKEQIAAALKLTREAADKYTFTLDGERPQEARLHAEPILRWSNPVVGEIHGNVFLWTVDKRPAVISSIFKWFTPHTHMSHEFHSLSQVPLSGRFEGGEVWKTTAASVQFAPVPEAPAPAASAAQRLLQMRQLAKNFAATKLERDGSRQEMRLLTQPIYRYEAPPEVLDGGLFVLVQGTDPEVFLLLEARGEAGKVRWEFAPARMNSVGFQVRYRDKGVWAKEVMPWRDVTSHAEGYTTYRFEMP